MNDEYLKDLKDIKDIMNRSSRFISLSGWSGIAAGLAASLGGYLAYQSIFSDLLLSYDRTELTDAQFSQLLFLAAGTLLVAIMTSILFTTRETRKQQTKIWDLQTKRLLMNLAIPLLTGGVVCLNLLVNGYIGLLMALSLVFYGLALLHASKYTLSEIRSLGLVQMLLGLVSLQFIEWSFYLWIFGFGLVHIVYGAIMQMKRA